MNINTATVLEAIRHAKRSDAAIRASRRIHDLQKAIDDVLKYQVEDIRREQGNGVPVVVGALDNYLRKARLSLSDARSFLEQPSSEPAPVPPGSESGGPGAAPPDLSCLDCVSCISIQEGDLQCSWHHENHCGSACSDFIER